MPQRQNSTPEIEIKLRITDQQAIEREILALGATPHPRVQEQNTLYDTPQSHLRRRKMLLRLRVETPAPQNVPATSRRERVILTSKAPPQDHSTRKRKSRYKIRAERKQSAPQPPRQYAKTLIALG